MSHFIKTCLAASAVVASNLAQAQLSANLTLQAGGAPVSAFGFSLKNLQGASWLEFSDDLIGALAVAGIQTSILAPGVGEVSDTAIGIGAPIVSASGILTAEAPGVNGAFSLTKVATLGGAKMVAEKANFATSGGALSVTGIEVDLSTRGIYATVSGANGLATQTVRVWDYAAIAGATTMKAEYGSPGFQNQITGLTITDQAFDLFAQGLGLKAGGIAAMASITDYGVMTSKLLVPEPSTSVLMGLGLAGLSLMTQRRRAS